MFKYLGRICTEDGKCKTEIRICMGLMKDAFEKLNGQFPLETKKKVLTCYVILMVLYGIKAEPYCWQQK